TPEGKVSVGGLGSYLKRTDPSSSPKKYGHSGLLDMLKTYDLLKVQHENGAHWTTQLMQKPGQPAQDASL
ncbi:MAG: OST-HTH/LOTUS domain-containing protein, partial [Proteobacteria bacterium]|nr:OST-HTH/LOTUS domain-containing protein [Pseudomonadota bacterium]